MSFVISVGSFCTR